MEPDIEICMRWISFTAEPLFRGVLNSFKPLKLILIQKSLSEYKSKRYLNVNLKYVK